MIACITLSVLSRSINDLLKYATRTLEALGAVICSLMMKCKMYEKLLIKQFIIVVHVVVVVVVNVYMQFRN